MDDAVTKKILQLHNIVDMTTDIVLSCELNPPMLVNWSNRQRTTKTASVQQSGCPNHACAPLPVVAGEGLGDGPNWSWSGTANTGISFTHERYSILALISLKKLNMFKHSCISDQSSHAMYGRPYFIFQIYSFYVSAWPPLFQILPSTTSIVCCFFCKSFATPLLSCPKQTSV